MPKGNLIKSTFTSGVLDPRLASRVDISHYERALRTGKNCVVTPFGGVRRRGGLRRVGLVTTDALGVNSRLIPFSYNSNTDQYLLVLTYDAGLGGAILRFYKNDALIANINGTGNSYLASPWPYTTYAKLRYAQTADVMVLVHEDYAPRTLVRGAADNLWTITAITFAAVPAIDYNDALSPVPTSEVQTITYAGAPAIGNTYRIDLEGVLTEPITWAGDATADQQNANIQRVRDALAALYLTGDGDIVVARTGALVYTVTFRNGAARSYGLMVGFLLTGTITLTIVKTVNGVPRTEPLWSAARGYPRTVSFYESRLVFGGTKSRPQTLCLSAVNDPYNFYTGQGQDDDAILRTLNTEQQNKIVGLVPAQHLQVFTEGAEFYLPDQPLTPGASSVVPQTTFGCNGVIPRSLDGATLFLEEKGRGLRSFLFAQIEQSYMASSASRLSSFLLNAPVDMAVVQTSRDDDGSYLYVVNADGTVAAMMSERSEEIVAWTPFETQGDFLAVAALTEDVYFLVQYTGAAGAQRTSLVKLDATYYTDDSTIGTQAPTVTWNFGTGEYNGIELRVRGDNAVLPNETPAGGIITLDYPVGTLEWGLNFDVEIRPMDAVIVSQNFVGVNHKARTGGIYVRIKDTLGLKINGRLMNERKLDITPLDTAPTAKSGVVYAASRGWGENVAPVLTQVDPLPLHVLSLEYEVELH